jgi:hypothetical protein
MLGSVLDKEMFSKLGHILGLIVIDNGESNVDTDDEEEEREKSQARGRAPTATELKRLDSRRTLLLTSPEVVTLYLQREEAKRG